jgi:hypothetical protein
MQEKSSQDDPCHRRLSEQATGSLTALISYIHRDMKLSNMKHCVDFLRILPDKEDQKVRDFLAVCVCSANNPLERDPPNQTKLISDISGSRSP